MINSWPDSIAVLLPAFNAAVHLKELLPHLMEYVPVNNILIVDDASHDETTVLCETLSIRCIRHDKNRGKGAALVTGFTRLITEGIQWIITMDADGQHVPEDLSGFIDAIKKAPSTGICIGARQMTRDIMPPERILSNKLTSFFLTRLCGITIEDSQCGYRIYNTNLLKKTTIFYKRFEMESEIIMKAAFLGFPVTFIKIKTVYLGGPSHIAHLRDTLRWIGAVGKVRMQRRSIIKNGIRQAPGD